MNAVSLADIAEKLQKIEINSILLHFPRGARRISNIKSNLDAENLRKQMLKLVYKRVIELSRISRHKLAGLYVEE